MKKLSPLILLLLSITGCSSGSFHVDNDYFNPFQKNSDKYYTHGTQFTYSEDSDNEHRDYSIGQTIYTPSAKHSDADAAILKNDRPYTGWLYGEYRSTKLLSDTVSETVGVQLGCTGPCSFAQNSQTTVHKAIGQDVPSWDRNYTLKSEPGFILEYEREKEINKYELYNEFSADTRAYHLSKLGNIIDSVSAGAIFRLGRNLDEELPNQIVFKAATDKPRSPWVYYAFVKAEERGVLYNHLLEGSLFQNERHTVDAEPLVREGNTGFTVGYKKFRFTYTYTLLSNEWKERKGGFAFGGVDFSW